MSQIFMVNQLIHGLVKSSLIRYYSTRFLANQIFSFLKFVIFRTDDYWQTISGRLQNIVYASTKTATYIRYVGITINSGQQTNSVNNKNIAIFDFGSCTFGVS